MQKPVEKKQFIFMKLSKVKFDEYYSLFDYTIFGEQDILRRIRLHIDFEVISPKASNCSERISNAFLYLFQFVNTFIMQIVCLLLYYILLYWIEYIYIVVCTHKIQGHFVFGRIFHAPFECSVKTFSREDSFQWGYCYGISQ